MKIDPTASLPAKISNLIAKLKKRAEKCSSETDVKNFLMIELDGKDANYIGEECQRLGITVEVASGKKTIIVEGVSELILAELEMFRGKRRESYDTLVAWLKNILGWSKVNNVNTQDLKSKATDLKNKRVKACRNEDEETKETMRHAQFKIPQKPSLSSIKQPLGTATPRKERTCTRCRSNTLQRTQKQLQTKREIEQLYLQIRALKHRETILNMKEQELNKKEKYLDQKESNLVELDDVLSERQTHYKPVNIDKRESYYKVKITEHKEKIKAQNEKLQEIRVKSKSKSDSIRNLTKKTDSEKDVTVLDREN